MTTATRKSLEAKIETLDASIACLYPYAKLVAAGSTVQSYVDRSKLFCDQVAYRDHLQHLVDGV